MPTHSKKEKGNEKTLSGCYYCMVLSAIDIPGLTFLDNAVSAWDSWIPVPLLWYILSWLEFSELTALRSS